MHLLFADGINIGFVFIAGIIVLVPLMAFEVFAEAFVLKKAWRLPFQELCSLTFFANCWSLLAGIPTKIFNAYLYSLLLPQDIPGFFARYPFAITLGSLVYFIVTVLIEGMYAIRWMKRKQAGLSRRQIWRGVLLANIATYIVLSPLYYFATKPHNEINRFSDNTSWTSHAATTILFVNYPDNFLKSIQADGSEMRTVVPFPLADYLVSSNLNICLFRGTNGNLYLYRRDTGKTNVIWQTTEHFYMNQVAFSPSGEYVAFASSKEKTIQIINVVRGWRKSITYASNSEYDYPTVVWSTEESKFFVDAKGASRLSVTIDPNDNPVSVLFEGTNPPPVLSCFGRVGGNGIWVGGSYWGINYQMDKCDDLAAASEAGLGSHLRISHQEGNRRVLTLAVNPGLLHIGGFWFGDVEFLDGCDECVFEANDYIYVLNINEKHLGKLTKGDRFIQLTSKFAKTFP
jgi:hypothetical protein